MSPDASKPPRNDEPSRLVGLTRGLFHRFGPHDKAAGSAAHPPSLRAGAGQVAVEEPGRTERALLLLLVAVPVLMNAIALLPELTIPAPSLNDDAFHFLMVQDAARTLSAGGNPLDFFMTQLELGFPQFLYYQNLPHLTVVALHQLLFGAVDLLTLFNLIRYLLLVGLPVTVYWSMRRMGFSMAAAAISGAASSLLSGNFRYGFEYDSYIWRGLGMYTQLWAMHLSFISLACVHKVLERGKGYLAAVVALTALALSHLIYAYMMVITLAIVLVVGARKATIVPRVVRLAIVGGVALVVSSYMWLPFLGSSQYLGASPYLQSWKYDSFGAPTILGWLASGDLLDHGRLPVLTLLLALGVIAALRRRGRLEVLALVGFVAWLVLYFGRPTLGPLTDLFPLHDSLLFHRFVGSVDLFAIILMGLGGAWLWSLLVRLPWARVAAVRPRLRVLTLAPWRVGVACAVLLLVLAPALAERIAFYAENGTWMAQTRDALADDTDLQSIMATLEAEPGGRAYAGLRSNWGAGMTVGQAKVSDILTFDAIPAVSPPYQSLSLNADMLWSFRDGDIGQYDLFDVRYVIVPSNFTVPAFYQPIQRTARYDLYSVPTSGVAEYVSIVARRQAPSQRALFDGNLAWVQGPDPDARRFIRWDYMTPAGPFVPSAGCPGGGKTDYELDQPGSIHLAVECSAAASLVIKMTYNPNWQVTVDGRPTPAYMVSPSYIGVDLPAGRHQVDATYVATPSKVPLLGVGLVVLIGLVPLRRRIDWLPQRLTHEPPPGTA